MRMKRTLTLALALLLLVTVAPIAPSRTEAATADECPGGGDHNWVIFEIPPTCTDYGMREYQCTKCYASRDYQELPPTGHDFSRWATVKAAICTEAGSRTATCLNGCGETRTESIPALGHNYVNDVCTRCGAADPAATQKPTAEPTPAPATLDETPITFPTLTEENVSEVLNLLRNVPLSAEEAGDLVVTLQPVGGLIPANGSYILTTAVEGGIAPYTYEWHNELALNVSDSMRQKLASTSALAYNKSKSGFANSFAAKAKARSKGTTGSTYSYGSTMYNKGLEPVSYDLNDHNLGQSDSPEYPATAAGSYYCVIRDSAGHWVSTEDAKVAYGLYISQQLQNVNLYQPKNTVKKTRYLTVTAAGGAGDYVYQWYYSFDGEGFYAVENGAEASLPVTEEGRYYCIVTDADGAEQESNTAIVYTAKPLTVTMSETDYTVETNEVVNLPVEFTISGGVSPYACQWYKGAELLETFMLEAGADGSVSDTRMITDIGNCSLVVLDAVGQMQIGRTTVARPRLKIAKQPEGGELRDGNPVELNIVMADGTAPYWYRLYENGENTVSGSGDAEYGFRAWEPGEYYIQVEDANGRMVNSDHVMVKGDQRPIITVQPQNVELEYREDGQYSTAALVCEAISTSTGDDSNLEYEWQMYAGTHRWKKNLGNTNILPVEEPGTYRCRVTDMETGVNVFSYVVTVKISLTALEAKVVAGNGHDSEIAFDYIGGKAPYELLIYRTYHNFKNNTLWLNIYRYTITAAEQLHPFVIWLEGQESYAVEFPLGSALYIPQTCSIDYYALVIDADGSRRESNIVSTYLR